MTPRQLSLHQLMRSLQRQSHVIRRIHHQIILCQLLRRLLPCLTALRSRKQQLPLLPFRKLRISLRLKLRIPKIPSRPAQPSVRYTNSHSYRRRIKSSANPPLQILRQPARQHNNPLLLRLLLTIQPLPPILHAALQSLNFHPQQLHLLLRLLEEGVDFRPEFEARFITLADGCGEVAQAVDEWMNLAKRCGQVF